jgi:hypothetical protein
MAFNHCFYPALLSSIRTGLSGNVHDDMELKDNSDLTDKLIQPVQQ